MKRNAARVVRAGNTEKVSISVARDDLRLLRARAKRLYGGNLSAVIAEAAERIREEEGRQALLAWLDPEGKVTEAEMDAIRAELEAPLPPPPPPSKPSKRRRKK